MLCLYISGGGGSIINFPKDELRRLIFLGYRVQRAVRKLQLLDELCGRRIVDEGDHGDLCVVLHDGCGPFLKRPVADDEDRVFVSVDATERPQLAVVAVRPLDVPIFVAGAQDGSSARTKGRHPLGEAVLHPRAGRGGDDGALRNTVAVY